MLLFLLFGLFNFSASYPSLPAFPLQFSARLKIINHLIDEKREYPLHEHIREVNYDYLNLRAIVKSLDEEDLNKVWLRRYDTVSKNH